MEPCSALWPRRGEEAALFAEQGDGHPLTPLTGKTGRDGAGSPAACVEVGRAAAQSSSIEISGLLAGDEPLPCAVVLAL